MNNQSMGKSNIYNNTKWVYLKKAYIVILKYLKANGFSKKLLYS